MSLGRHQQDSNFKETEMINSSIVSAKRGNSWVLYSSKAKHFQTETATA